MPSRKLLGRDASNLDPAPLHDDVVIETNHSLGHLAGRPLVDVGLAILSNAAPKLSVLQQQNYVFRKIADVFLRD